MSDKKLRHATINVKISSNMEKDIRAIVRSEIRKQNTLKHVDGMFNKIHSELMPPLKDNKPKKMTSFDQYKESVDLNNYFANKGYTVSQTKNLCKWYLETVDNTQQITRYEGD